MRTAFLIAALSLCGPAQARPQWLPVGDPEDRHTLDFNSIRGVGTTRSATLSLRMPDSTAKAITFHVDCAKWWYSVTHYLADGATTQEWKPIGAETLGEDAAYLICPK
jgi:hypothetical protein